MDYLVTNGKTLPLCGKEKIAQLKKQHSNDHYDT